MKERELEDDYPIYAGYLYVADGEVIRSDKTTDAKTLKTIKNYKSLKGCDIAGRGLWHLAI